MGIALAIPLDKYEVEKVDISRCSDTVRMPREPKPDRGILQKLFVEKPVEIYRALTGNRPQQSDWQLARNRFNTIMYAGLKCKDTGVEFGIANYHMPCMFRNPKVMTIHSQLAAMYAQRMAGDLPAVLMVRIVPISSCIHLSWKLSVVQQRAPSEGGDVLTSRGTST